MATTSIDLNEQQSQLKILIAKGKDQGYLTYAEVNDHLPAGIVDPEQIEDIVSMINDMGITVHEEELGVEPSGERAPSSPAGRREGAGLYENPPEKPIGS